MAKRKCVRHAIIEISDSANDDDDDDQKSVSKKNTNASVGNIGSSGVISTNSPRLSKVSLSSSSASKYGEAHSSLGKFKYKGKPPGNSVSKTKRKRPAESIESSHNEKKTRVKRSRVKENTKNSEKMGASTSEPEPVITSNYDQLNTKVLEETRKLREEEIQRKILEEHWQKQKAAEEEKRLKAQREWNAQQLLNQQVLRNLQMRVEMTNRNSYETRQSTREQQRITQNAHISLPIQTNPTSQIPRYEEPYSYSSGAIKKEQKIEKINASKSASQISTSNKSSTITERTRQNSASNLIKSQKAERSSSTSQQSSRLRNAENPFSTSQQTSRLQNAENLFSTSQQTSRLPNAENPFSTSQQTSRLPNAENPFSTSQQISRLPNAENPFSTSQQSLHLRCAENSSSTSQRMTECQKVKVPKEASVIKRLNNRVKSDASQPSTMKLMFNNKPPFPTKKQSQSSESESETETRSLYNGDDMAMQSKTYVQTNYIAQLNAAKINFTEWSLIEYVVDLHGISKTVANNITQLLDDDNTIPFIARYRRDKTGGLEAEELRAIKFSYEQAKLIKRKALMITKEVDKSGKWTPELHTFVHGTRSLHNLVQVQSLFKVNKSTLAEQARDLGLGPTAEAIFKGEPIMPLNCIVDPKKEGISTEDKVTDGIINILADMINKDPQMFEIINKIRSEYPMNIKSTKTKIEESDERKSSKKKEDEKKYDLYHNFSAAENNLRPHQILAINRGEARKILSVKVIVPNSFEQNLLAACFTRYKKSIEVSQVHKTLMTKAISYAYKKHMTPSIKRRTRQKINEVAELASMDVFAQNVKELLLSPPVRGKVVLGIDPGFRHGCKLAVVSEQGEVLDTSTLYLHLENNATFSFDAEETFIDLVRKHKCTVIALGNGKACRQTEVFLSDLIKKKAFAPLDVVYAIVDETGASIYSCSPIAAEEFPALDVNVVSAVSIARRLQDPMAELVKIEPKHLGVGMYQHDLPEKQLAAKLNEVIMEAVSFVGVDINTASLSLLTRIAGLTESRAKSIIEWRKNSGPFKSRSDLLSVKGIGKRTFEQCAGFVRINPETAFKKSEEKSFEKSFEYLDQTWIHPESYDIAREFLKAAKCDIREWGTKMFIFKLNLFANQNLEVLAKKFETNVETIELIVKGLMMEKGLDIRAKSDAAMFRKNATSIDDLTIGTKLTGIVRNITDFGAFVDIGVEINGLIHKKFMGGIILSRNNRVEVTVNNIEKERRRIGLTLIKCI